MAKQRDLERQMAEITKPLIEIEALLWQVRSSDPDLWVRHGMISAAERQNYDRLNTIRTMIQAEIRKAGESVPYPDLIEDPRCPPEYKDAVRRLRDLVAEYNRSSKVRELLYHAGATAFGESIYLDSDIAAKADMIRNRLCRIGELAVPTERWGLERFIERRERYGSKVHQLKQALNRQWETERDQAKVAKQMELESKHYPDLIELAAIEQGVDERRREIIKVMAVTVKAILDDAAEAIDNYFAPEKETV